LLEEEEEEERQIMERAIGESVSSSAALNAVDDALNEAIEESLRVLVEDANRSSGTVNDEFELAIQESLGFTETQRSLEEEEEAMKQAMEESVSYDTVGHDAIIDVDTEQMIVDERLGESSERPKGTEEEEDEAMRRAMEESLLVNDSTVSPINDDDDMKRAIGESLKEDGISRVASNVAVDEEEALKRAIEESKASVAKLQTEDDVMKQAIENSRIENTRNRAFYEEEKIMDLAMEDESWMDNVCTLADDSIIKHSIENSPVNSNSITHSVAVTKEQTFEDHPTTILRETGRAAPQCNLSLNFG